MGRSAGGGLGGRGGRDGVQAAPVEQYRKRIGRQDSKNQKKHFKEVKHSPELAKDRAPKAIKETVRLKLSYFSLSI